jgi:hypothetical protein
VNTEFPDRQQINESLLKRTDVTLTKPTKSIYFFNEAVVSRCFAPILHFILFLSEVYRVTEPEEKSHGHNVQHPPVSCKPLEFIHG